MTVTSGTVNPGDPVLHELVQEVAPGDVSSEKVQGTIDRGSTSCARPPADVGLTALQISFLLRVFLICCLRGMRACLSLTIMRIINKNSCPIPNLVIFVMLDRRLHINVLEDTQEYISYAPKKDIEVQDLRPFDLLVDRAGPEISRALVKIIYGGPSIFLYINLLVYIYIVLYKYIIEVSKYMNINYFYRAPHFNIYKITLTGIIKTYLVLCIIL
jgi:hypothetical protein